MRAVLLIDFGSTFTKLTAVDVEGRRVLGTAQHFTTTDSDIRIGLDKALELLIEKTGPLAFEAQLACSSAAGGLRMVACGLVPELTAKAARLAAYGAGAKVLKTYAFELNSDDLKEITTLRPDILLLVGGTDGGNTEVVLKNAESLAKLSGEWPIIYAGNRAAKDGVQKLLEGSSHRLHLCENVMPTFGKINERPAQQMIRDIFLERIVRAKGLSQVGALLDDILMPTPAAVLSALTLYSQGLDGKGGAGELVAVDLGGATTDVYSIASGEPTRPSTMLSGLREPYVKRTVEGDIGMRFGAAGVLAAVGEAALAQASGLTEEDVVSMVKQLEATPSALPGNVKEEALDAALATHAIRVGLVRHSGELQQVYTPVGPMYHQVGKDLSQVGLIVLTGGALIHAKGAADLAYAAVHELGPESLAPRRFKVVMDSDYLLSAMGLLAGLDAGAALHMMQTHLKREEDNAAAQQEVE